MASTRRTLLLSLSLLLFVNRIHAEDRLISIRDPGDLIRLSNEVNNGNGIFRGTVVLENDLDMTGLSPSFNPIGFSKEKTFSGEFDGKGYTISNLNITVKSSYFIGLFGISGGMTLKNLVLDKSCSMASSSSITGFFSKGSFGGFAGLCVSQNDDCVFQNLINMANLFASGNDRVGGIVGSISAMTFNSRIVSCLNFGGIDVNGVNIFIAIGGIAGGTSSTGVKVIVQNCANYGRSKQSSLNFMSRAGGLVGEISNNTEIQNCLNIGEYVGSKFQIGSFMIDSDVLLNIKIRNCYWPIANKPKTTDEDNDKSVAEIVKESVGFLPNLTLSSPVIVNDEEKTDVIEALNFFRYDGFKGWMDLDFNGGGITREYPLHKIPFHKNKKALVVPVRNGCTFKGWYSDPEYESKFNPETDDISKVNTLYARWVFPIKVTFTFGAERVEKIITNDDVIEFPNVEMGYGHRVEWCTRGKKICNPVKSEESIDLYLVQYRKDYTLSFNANGGKEIESRVIMFDDLVEELPAPEREGFEFLGWFADAELKNPIHSLRMPGYDMCLYAKWRDVSSEEKTFARFATIVCISLGVLAGSIAFAKKDVVDLKKAF